MSALTLELVTEPNQRLDLSPLTTAGLAGRKPKDIQAIAIGTTRETVTRMLKDLERQGLVKIEGREIVLQPGFEKAFD